MAATIEIAEESELQARLRIARNPFKDRQNCIVLKVDTHVNGEKGVNPFGFHFELDKDKYLINRREERRKAVTKWLSFIALVHHRFGIRHLLLVLTMALLLFLGGALFEGIEADNEIILLNATLEAMDVVMDQFVIDIENISLSETNETVRTDMLMHRTEVFYKDMLKTEDRYIGSAWHKAENLDLNLTWNFWSATFYSFTLFSTIGYGTVVCYTWIGRWMSVLYASVGIPLMLLTLGDLGELLQRNLVRGIEMLKEKIWSRGGQGDTDIEDGGGFETEEEGEEEGILPVWIASSLLLVYIVIVSFYVYIFDTGEQGHISLESSFYFVFISLTTIGLGDVMPSSIQYDPITALCFLFGLTLISIINSSVYSQLYDTFYTGVTAVEGTLDAIHERSYEKEGHRLFKKLEPVFTTLVLSFPSSSSPRPLPDLLFTSPSIHHPSTDSISSNSSPPRSSSFSLPPIAHNISVTRNHSVVTRPRAPTLLVPGTQEFDRKVEKNVTRARRRAPTLGAFGAVETARIRRVESERVKRERKESERVERERKESERRERERAESERKQSILKEPQRRFSQPL